MKVLLYEDKFKEFEDLFNKKSYKIKEIFMSVF